LDVSVDKNADFGCPDEMFLYEVSYPKMDEITYIVSSLSWIQDSEFIIYSW
jgi:hypothetical protein